MNDKPKNLEMMSALADGQLRGRDVDEALALAHDDAQSARAWQTYHLVGDVMRSADLASAADDAAFLARLRGRLAQTETPAAVAAQQVVAAVTASSQVDPVLARTPAGNEAAFRWKMVAGFASLAAVGAIGWSVLGATGGVPAGTALPQGGPADGQIAARMAPAAAVPPGAVTVATSPDAGASGGSSIGSNVSANPRQLQVARSVDVAGTRQVMIRDPRLDELMAAHRRFGGNSALQMPAGFLRDATFEGPAR